ncbi:MAG: hypothetical protein C0395_05350 [Gemmatimonas sp.]|nr:hypothetical protein [Gemmatimonas sp.]
MHAVAMLLILVSALTAQATTSLEATGSTLVTVVATEAPAAPPANDLVHEYGDPDDAITGNRGNNVAGGLPIFSPTSSTQPSSALAAWLIAVIMQVVPSF